MKVMGITGGRKGGNTEILLKEALSACRDQGAEVCMINLHDFKINPCTGCEGCTINNMKGGKEPFCVWKDKDDYFSIAYKMLEMDCFIFSVPTYDLMPASVYLNFAHRQLPFEMSFLKKQGIIDEIPDRVGGIISLGGSSRSWQSLALECMAATTFTSSIEVVDMQLATRNSAYRQVLLRPEQVQRAYQLGLNVVKARNTPQSERKWMGDPDMGLCPICHSNAVIKGEEQWDGVHFEMECAVCGSGGTLERDESGKLKFVLAENGDSRCRVYSHCRELHLDEIMHNHETTHKNADVVKERVEKYRGIEIPKALETGFKDFR